MGRSSRHRPSGSRCILTQIGCYRVAFPTALVAEIALFERSRLLPLPMYPPRCMGVVYHRGTLMPLYSLRAEPLLRESFSGTLTAIRLGAGAGQQAGIGIEIDTVIEQVSLATISPDAPPDFNTQDVTGIQDFELDQETESTLSGDESSHQIDGQIMRPSVTDDGPSSIPHHVFSLDDIDDQHWSPCRSVVSLMT